MNYFKIKMRSLAEFNRREGRRGIVVYFAASVLLIVLTIALGVSSLSVAQLKSLNEASNSVVAFAAAETGIEWALRNVALNDPPYTSTCPWNPSLSKYVCILNASLSNGAKYTVTATACGAGGSFLCATSVGEFQNTQRALKIMR